MRFFLAAAVLLSAAAAHAETLFTVPWGKGAGQLGYYNASTPPFDQPYGEGPGGIALGPSGEIWISDQFNDRILRFDRAGKLLGMVGKVGEERLVRPRALWVDPGKAVAVVNAKDMVVLWLDQKTRKLEKLSASGTPRGTLGQVELVQGAGADLVVGDFMHSALYTYTRGAATPKPAPWGLTGWARDAAGRTYALEHRASPRPDYWLVSTDAKGAKKDHFALVAPELTTPSLIGVDAAGNAYVRFVKPGAAKDAPPGENPNRFLIVKYDPAGKGGQPLGETKINVVGQGFVVTPEGTVVGLSFEPMTAPEGGVEVIELR